VAPPLIVDGRLRLGAAALILIALPFAIYSYTLSYGLLGYDDSIYYTQNPPLKEGRAEGLISLWSGVILSDYTPVTQLTLWIDLALFGQQAWWGARLHGIVWFVIGVLAVYALMRRISERHAFAVALLLAVHPVCVQSVVWLAERKQLVSFALAFWSMERYVAARTAEQTRAKISAGMAAFTLAVAALFAKPHAVAIPVMLSTYELFIARDAWLRRAAWLAPFVVLTAAFTLWNLSIRTDLARPFLGGSRLNAVLIDGGILLRYLQQTVFPAGLTLYYFVNESAPVSTLLLAWAGVLAIVAASVALSPQPRVALFGWALAVAALSPALNLVPQLAPMTDHYLHWALPGVLLVVVLLAERLVTYIPSQRIPVLPAIATALAATALAVLSLLRLPEFANKEALFSAAIVKEPESAFNWAHYVTTIYGRANADRRVLGDVAVKALTCGDADRLLPQERTAVAIEAVVRLRQRGPSHAAEETLERQTRLLEKHSPQAAMLLRGHVEMRSGRMPHAIAALSPPFNSGMQQIARALRERCRDGSAFPDQFPPMVSLSALSDAQSGDDFSAAMLLDLLGLLGEAYLRNKEPERAFDVLAVLVNMRPDYGPGRELLAETYEALGNTAAAKRLAAAK